MTTSISSGQGSHGEEQLHAPTSQSQNLSEQFRQPESAVAGVTPGEILANAEPNRDDVRMKDMWQWQKDLSLIHI